MKVCIVGAGAIGGFLGTKIAAMGLAQVSAVARGETLLSLKQHGWRLLQNGVVQHAPVHASESPESLGRQDVVIIAVKGPALTHIAEIISPLLDDKTVVMPAMNGVPWWFGEGVEALPQAPFKSLDPAGKIAAAIPLPHIIGCVVHASCSSPVRGLVAHKMGRGLVIGEPKGGKTERVQNIAQMLTAAGFDTTVSDNIRKDIWYKLWGNLTMNPVSAVTGATIDKILNDPLARAFCSATMLEASAIGALIGCTITETPEDRHAVTAKLGAFKTSMLQDAEAGRMIELDSVVAAVQEIGQRLGIHTPNIDALLGLTRLFARTRGLYPKEVSA